MVMDDTRIMPGDMDEGEVYVVRWVDDPDEPSPVHVFMGLFIGYKLYNGKFYLKFDDGTLVWCHTIKRISRPT